MKTPFQYISPNLHNENSSAITIVSIIKRTNFIMELSGLLFHSDMISKWEIISILYRLPLLSSCIFGDICWKFSFHNYAKCINFWKLNGVICIYHNLILKLIWYGTFIRIYHKNVKKSIWKELHKHFQYMYVTVGPNIFALFRSSYLSL